MYEYNRSMALPWHNQVDIIAAFSFVGFVLISIPLYWHFQCMYRSILPSSGLELTSVHAAWNIGCILYIFWVGGQCLFHAINLHIWRDNVINSAPVWCDICKSFPDCSRTFLNTMPPVIRFYIAASIGVCSASLVINRRLYLIATMSTVSAKYEDKRRNMLCDLLIGLGIPVLAMGLCECSPRVLAYFNPF